MTENIPQTSASDRIEAARKALAWYDDDSEAGGGIVAGGAAVAEALRALITPPSVGESVEGIARRLHDRLDDAILTSAKPHPEVMDGIKGMLLEAVRAGIQYAHERWEPSDRPSQEQMLRWLGLDCFDSTDDEGEPSIFIRPQHIDREEI